ncbi:MAG: AAA family ATPase [Gammaproteobacteria bacterium]|nr:AAA family ATPase [Gammaproteobacteria bacterium]
MLRLRRVEITRFACFDNIVIEPSIDSERPLTVIRAENGSGKTTFLRALRWGMYGEKGLPGDSARFSVHPAWWRPNDDRIKTEVEIEFETDGSTRHDMQGNATSTVYHLVRSVTTIGKPASRDDEPDFRRINEQAQLMTKGDDGRWNPHTSGVDLVIERLLPWDLRDFFVMDADEAADFVGGSENKVMSRRAVIDKTTAAVHSLLGIDVFKAASERVKKIARDFGAQATKAIGDANLDMLQKELDQLRAEKTELTDKISDQRTQKTELEDRLRRRQDDLETELKGVGAADELRVRLSQNRRHYERAINTQRTTLARLVSHIESTDLLASLARSKIANAYATLRPLYEQGYIPLKHVNFVRELLESGVCVCGQNLSDDGIHRAHVEDRIAESAEQEERANYHGLLHDAAKSLMQRAAANHWEDQSTRFTGDLSALRQNLSDLSLEKQDIDNKLDKIDEEKIHVIRDEIDALETQVETLNRKLAVDEVALPPLVADIGSREKRIRQRHRNERAAADQRAAEGMAKRVAEALDRAYGTIRAKQVSELSQRMNRLFARMAANVSDDDFVNFQGNKATLKMIAEVGLRPVDSKCEDYEICAMNSRARAMPPIEINGASRRVLALSFVLALCTESKTQAPLVADSLLNFMSGAVRRNTLRVTATTSSQPILLLTGSDLGASSEAEIVARYAGATFTLTGQWDAIDAGQGGDVLKRTVTRPVALVCACGPRQYCEICERTGQADSPGWSRRN